MNKRIKNKRRKYSYCTAKQRKRNKKLCERYPFLIPRSVWSDKTIWDQYKDTRKWSSTLAEDFPKGWWKAFGLMMCEELREDLIKCNYLNKFRFEQIKEKYGQLRAYTNSVPYECNAIDIIDKYTHLSENICISCGCPDVPMVYESWISPECFSCYYKRQVKNDKHLLKHGIKQIRTWGEIRDKYNDITRSDDAKMTDSITWKHYDKDGDDWIETIDISDTANAIRERWRKQYE